MSRPAFPITTPNSTAEERDGGQLEVGRQERTNRRTFVVHHYSLRDLNLAVLAEGVRAGRLEEEEGFLGSRVVELLDVGSVVATDGNTLLEREKR